MSLCLCSKGVMIGSDNLGDKILEGCGSNVRTTVALPSPQLTFLITASCPSWTPSKKPIAKLTDLSIFGII